jgi:site-specific DNA-methyltransferase (adenine-specific)
VLDTEAAAMLDAQSGDRPVSGSARNGRPATGNDYDQSKTVYGIGFGSIQGALYDDAGGASRFFYVPKASREERNAGLAGMAERKPHADEPNGRAWDIPGSHSTPRANHHPTVKPVELMRWLIRLITPPGGIVLDPFNGSGSTGCAAAAEGVAYIGLELDADYCEISRRRIAWWMREAEIERQQLRMFAVEEVPTIAADTKMQALSLF